MIAIIDYGAGNLRSVTNAVKHLGYRAVITADAGQILASPAVILPGVGAAADTMLGLKKTGLDRVIKQLVEQGRPLLAICVGLQVLFTRSEEDGGCNCLDILPGQVKRFQTGLKIPHMGWNQVNMGFTHPLKDGIADGSSFYFAHSYYARPQDSVVVAGTTCYQLEFASLVTSGNVFATQFHPEKSGQAGLKLYDNFINLALKGTVK
jgi:glutamine amidotransferase